MMWLVIVHMLYFLHIGWFLLSKYKWENLLYAILIRIIKNFTIFDEKTILQLVKKSCTSNFCSFSADYGC